MKERDSDGQMTIKTKKNEVMYSSQKNYINIGTSGGTSEKTRAKFFPTLALYACPNESNKLIMYLRKIANDCDVMQYLAVNTNIFRSMFIKTVNS